ncbi:DUF4430 domain-containing protein [Chloroflexota bacterium]
MNFKKLIPLLLIALLLTLIPSCSTEASLPLDDTNPIPVDNTEQATVVVTRDFGSLLLVEENLAMESNMTALDALQQVTEVETKYGGGFIDSINDISSSNEGSNGEKKDWFFYINGLSVKTGAKEYTLHDGDVEYWDFRDWSFRQFIPALIGGFPEPFLHGYGGIIYPTVVVYQDGWEETAGQVADSLSQLGVSDISTSSVTELPAERKESANLILLGTSNHQLIAEINQAWDRLGFYAHFHDNYLKAYNSAGDLIAENGAGSGVIQATQSPWNPKGIGVCENVVWIISGTDTDGVAAAVDTLVNHYSDFKYAYSVLLDNGELIKVPQ